MDEVADLKAELAALRRKLDAKERTLQVLMTDVEERLARAGGGIATLEQNLRLSRAVDLKTSELEAEGRKLAEALRDLKMAQAELTQSQKLGAIGQLAAGVAHEINTPIQYVGDNLTFLQKVFQQTLAVLSAYSEGVAGDAGASERAKELLAKVKLPRLAVQVPRALEQAIDGVTRVSKIVGAMKDFSHPSGGEKHEVDLRSAIESTVTIARNEWKYVADLEIDIPADLPRVRCLRDELNQVILNLVINASHAISELLGENSEKRGRIVVGARVVDNACEIRVSDTGGGIPEAIRTKVFDPFFTTKPVGKGTGQGLAIAYNVIVDKHGGTLSFETEQGVGTTFIMRIPLSEDADTRSAA